MSALAVRATSDALKMRTLRVPVRAIAQLRTAVNRFVKPVWNVM